MKIFTAVVFLAGSYVFFTATGDLRLWGAVAALQAFIIFSQGLTLSSYEKKLDEINTLATEAKAIMKEVR